MHIAKRRFTVLLIALVFLMLLPGCTNWKQKYLLCNSELANIGGRLDREKVATGQLEERVAQDQQTIEDLQRQIEQQKKSPAEATGFGEGYDVKFDAAAGTVTVTLPNAILFNSGKADLKNATSTELDHITSVLKGSRYSGRLIDVVGHTDSDPIKKSPWKDNWELSAQRALSVLRYLVKRGMSDDKIRAIGRGASNPVASNSSASGKAKNRRVEIVVHLK